MNKKSMFAPLQARYAALQPQEQRAVLVLGWAVGLFLLWIVAIAPAWKVVRGTPAEREKLDQSLMEMQAQAAEAQLLRAVPAVQPAQARQALQAAADRLGPAVQLQLASDRAVFNLKGLRGDQLSALLNEARTAARARAVEAHLQRAGDGYTGNLILVLPGGGA
jgi:general secretion pathway protein M